jgi:N-acetylglucosaminyldiphosphoundecaprenol N-acetyl-beta-D-mannosaminyltransferase
MLNNFDFPSVLVLGVRIHTIPVTTLMSYITQTIKTGKKALISYANIHTMNLAYEKLWFRDFLNSSDIVFCDGFGVMFGAYILGQKIKYRYTPPDWLPILAHQGVEYDHRWFFLGAQPGVAEKAAQKMQVLVPGLHFSGTHHGYFDKTPGCDENEQVCNLINEVQPNILIIGFGMPLQEKWLLENFNRLRVNVAIPAGAALDYLAGSVKRSPRWMTDHGMEWLGRFLIEPRRLWRRYIIGNPIYFWRILMERFRMYQE